MLGLLSLVFADLGAARLVQIPRVTGLPSPHPYAISADGQVVIGQFAPGNPFIWKQKSTQKFRVNPTVLDQYAQSLSQDGSVIVGRAGSAFRYERGQTQYIGPKGTFAYGVSSDGKVVVGQVETRAGTSGFRWELGSYQPIPEFSPLSVSADGSTIVGIRTKGGTIRAQKWQSGEVQELPLQPEVTDSSAFASNRDGSKIVGNMTRESGTTQAVVWRASGDVLNLNNGGKEMSSAKCITPDGSWIGGFVGDHAAVWSAEGRLFRVVDELRGAGVSTSGWTFESVNGIARVGRTLYITGWGRLGKRDAGYYATFQIRD